MPRITFTIRCRDSGLCRYFRENVPRNFRRRFGMPREISFALRFLKHNPPGLHPCGVSHQIGVFRTAETRLGRGWFLL